MNKVNITDKGILEYYGNRVGFVKNDTAYVDEMFRKKDIEEFLSGENGLNIEWQMTYMTDLCRAKSRSRKVCRLKDAVCISLKRRPISVCVSSGMTN